MIHDLIFPLWLNIDEKRSKSALAGEMTPLTLDMEEGKAAFAGSTAIYFSTLTGCTCLDFQIGQARSAPCKHMIRLAMELLLLPDAGIVNDIEAARYRVALSEATAFVKNEPVPAVAGFIHGLSVLYEKKTVQADKSKELDTVAPGYFFTWSVDGKHRMANHVHKKDALALIKMFEARLGEWMLEHYDICKKVISEEG